MSNKSNSSFRLITRSDFDGLVCAVLLKMKEQISEVLFVHPRDMQEGLIKVGPQDISSNLPYVSGVYRAFDHHSSEVLRISGEVDNHIINSTALSAARVVYDYYGGESAFKNIPTELMDAVDKCDSAHFTIPEIFEPQGWVLLNFIMDSRTGLGRFKNFRISNYQLMMDLIDYCSSYTIGEILELTDVHERVLLYQEHRNLFREQIQQHTTLHGNVLVLDIRPISVIYSGNRFVKYALYPETNVSIQVLWSYQKQKTVFTVGKSIFNKTAKHNIGDVMLRYDGGGHVHAGSCQIDNDKAETVLQELINIFNEKN